MTEEEFKHSILPLGRNIYSFALNLIGDADEAADISQEVMCRLWDNRHTLEKVDNPKSWALKTTRNLSLDWMKRHKPVYDDNLVREQGLYSEGVLEEIEKRDISSLVQRLIDTLPDNQREVMILRELEGMEYNEISEITGFGLNNIRVLLSRGRSRIKEILIEKYHLSRYDN